MVASRTRRPPRGRPRPRGSRSATAMPSGVRPTRTGSRCGVPGRGSRGCPGVARPGVGDDPEATRLRGILLGNRANNLSLLGRVAEAYRAIGQTLTVAEQAAAPTTVARARLRAADHYFCPGGGTRRWSSWRRLPGRSDLRRGRWLWL